jgi:hypothetical protein
MFVWFVLTFVVGLAIGSAVTAWICQPYKTALEVRKEKALCSSATAHGVTDC